MPEQDLIEVLKKAIKNDKNAQISAIMGRVPVLCESVLQIHEMQKETNSNVKALMLQVQNLAFSMRETINTKDADDKYLSIKTADLTFAKKDGTYPFIKALIITGVGLILIALLYTGLRKLGLQTQ